ncbi:hypothetical protein MHYP_G00051030 [Metynnis hypsauchen]
MDEQVSKNLDEFDEKVRDKCTIVEQLVPKVKPVTTLQRDRSPPFTLSGQSANSRTEPHTEPDINPEACGLHQRPPVSPAAALTVNRSGPSDGKPELRKDATYLTGETASSGAEKGVLSK